MPRDLQRLIQRESGPADYTFVAATETTMRLILGHPRARQVIEAMRCSGRISDGLADELMRRIDRDKSS